MRHVDFKPDEPKIEPMDTLKVLIADHDPESTDILSRYIKEFPTLKLMGVDEHLSNLNATIQNTQAQALFLGMDFTGFDYKDVLEQLFHSHRNLKVIAINISHGQLNELSHLPIFYHLFKPIEKFQLESLVNKLMSKLDTPKSNDLGKIKLPIKNGYLYLKKEEILMLEAEGNYTSITTHSNEVFISSYNMGRLLQRLDSNSFFRVNRSCVVNAVYLRKVDTRQKVCLIQLDQVEKEISVSQTFISHFNKSHK